MQFSSLQTRTTYVAIDPRHRMVFWIERCTPHGTTLLWRLCGLKIWIWSNEKASRKGASIDPMMACQERIYMISLVFDRARCDMKCWWCLNYNRHSRRSSRKTKSSLYSLIGVACISNVAINFIKSFIYSPSISLSCFFSLPFIIKPLPARFAERIKRNNTRKDPPPARPPPLQTIPGGGTGSNIPDADLGVTYRNKQPCKRSAR